MDGTTLPLIAEHLDLKDQLNLRITCRTVKHLMFDEVYLSQQILHCHLESGLDSFKISLAKSNHRWWDIHYTQMSDADCKFYYMFLIACENRYRKAIGFFSELLIKLINDIFHYSTKLRFNFKFKYIDDFIEEIFVNGFEENAIAIRNYTYTRAGFTPRYFLKERTWLISMAIKVDNIELYRKYNPVLFSDAFAIVNNLVECIKNSAPKCFGNIFNEFIYMYKKKNVVSEYYFNKSVKQMKKKAKHINKISARDIILLSINADYDGNFKDVDEFKFKLEMSRNRGGFNKKELNLYCKYLGIRCSGNKPVLVDRIITKVF